MCRSMMVVLLSLDSMLYGVQVILNGKSLLSYQKKTVTYLPADLGRQQTDLFNDRRS